MTERQSESPAVQAAVDAALATERRFAGIEASLAGLTALVERGHEQMSALVSLINAAEDASIRRDAENLAEVRVTNGSVKTLENATREELAWRARHEEDSKLIKERVGKLWEASRDGVTIRRMWRQQLALVATGATAMAGVGAALRYFGVI